MTFSQIFRGPMRLSQYSLRHTLHTLLAQIIVCHLLSSFGAAQDEQFPLIKQCLKANSGPNIDHGKFNLCLERGGGLNVKVPKQGCAGDNEETIITGFKLLTPKPQASSLYCKYNDVDGFNYKAPVNSSCLQAQGYSHQVKNVVLPLMRMYNGLNKKGIENFNPIEYHDQLGPDGQQLPTNTWLTLATKCVERKSTTLVLKADICANEQHTGADAVHIEFFANGGAYDNQSSCSCNILSSRVSENAQFQTLTARAVDIRLQGSTAALHLSGKGNSRVLDGSEILYWEADGDLLTSQEQLFLKLNGLSSNKLHQPERMWLEVRGPNLTVNCGPADQPGGHQPLAAESSSLGIGYIVAIIVGLVILLILVVVLVKCVLQRKRRRGSSKDEDDEFDISMGSKEDIRDRHKLRAIRQQMSTDSGMEPAVEIKTEAEVMCSNPRMVASPADESQRALLHDRDDEEDGNGNNNTTAKKAPGTPPPPPHDPHNHEYRICRQLSYIDEDEAAFPPPPTVEEDIYNHLNEKRRPDVVPGNIYDTSPVHENVYSTTSPQKKRGLNGPLPEDNYVT